MLDWRPCCPCVPIKCAEVQMRQILAPLICGQTDKGRASSSRRQCATYSSANVANVAHGILTIQVSWECQSISTLQDGYRMLAVHCGSKAIRAPNAARTADAASALAIGTMVSCNCNLAQ